jgi:hypothetical protein
MESTHQVRDYDKDPIVIEDYNPLFMASLAFSVVPIMIYVYIYNPGGTSEQSLFRNMVIIIPLTMYPYFNAYLKSRKKRKIVLANETIKFNHGNVVIEEIKLSEIVDIKKTYSDIYHKSQYLKWFQSLGLFIVFPLIIISQKFYYLLFIIPFVHIFLISTKYIFHKIKDNKYKYQLFDSFMIYSNESFINILPTTSKEYEVVRNYFLTKNLGDIQNKKIYFELLGHGFEKSSLGA